MSQLQELTKIGNELREKYHGKFDEYLTKHNKDFASVVYSQIEFELFLEWYHQLEKTTRAHFEELKYKKPKVKLSGEDGNVFNLIGICKRALVNIGEREIANKMVIECVSSGSYEEALRVMSKYVDVE